jgi:hypothetical protein
MQAAAYECSSRTVMRCALMTEAVMGSGYFNAEARIG